MAYGDDAEPGPYGFIEVADTGVGMNKGQVARMFDPYYSTKHDGHGLGLAAMLGIVHGHSGAIRVDSELGNGTTIKVFLPIAKDAFETVDRHHELQDGNGEFVLVVDDQELVRSLTTKALEHAGYQVITAANGLEGIEMFREHSDSLKMVLLDMTMPIMEGNAALKEMSRIDPNIPVVLMSGYHEQDATDQLEGRELAGFIQKPFRLNKLLKVVADAGSD
jgi:CheY-like chemotaxis protein